MRALRAFAAALLCSLGCGRVVGSDPLCTTLTTSENSGSIQRRIVYGSISKDGCGTNALAGVHLLIMATALSVEPFGQIASFDSKCNASQPCTVMRHGQDCNRLHGALGLPPIVPRKDLCPCTAEPTDLTNLEEFNRNLTQPGNLQKLKEKVFRNSPEHCRKSISLSARRFKQKVGELLSSEVLQILQYRFQQG